MKTKTKQLRYALPDGREHIIDIVSPGEDPPSMEQILHDCPECRAAMERGEKPVIVTGEELKEIAAAYESRQVRRARLRRVRKHRRN